MNDVTSLELQLVGPPSWDEAFERPPQLGPHSYDRRGNPLTFREWATLMEYIDRDGKRYTIVKQEHVGDYWVSTVWLGLDHGFGGPVPLIFETMVFFHGEREDDDEDRHSDLDQERYATEEAALEGHARICDKVRLINEAFS